MNTAEMEDRTRPDYLKQVERDYRADGREETADDYKACRLKIKLLDERVRFLERKERAYQRMVRRCLSAAARIFDVPVEYDDNKQAVIYTGIFEE